MTTPQPPKLALNDAELLNAYADGELPALDASALEARMAADSALKQSYAEVSAVREAVAGNLDRASASPSFRMRIARIPHDQQRNGVFKNSVFKKEFMGRASLFDWRAMAACAVVAAGLSSAVTYVAVSQDTSLVAGANLVAVHRHALLAANPVEVASTDQHTVKPWFDAKLALAPPVVDLSAGGYPLAGGRVDTLDGQQVPVMIYRHRAHLMSLVAVPRPGSRDTGAAPRIQTRDGYTVITWSGHDFVFSAISDVSRDDFQGFVSQLRAAHTDD